MITIPLPIGVTPLVKIEHGKATYTDAWLKMSSPEALDELIAACQKAKQPREGLADGAKYWFIDDTGARCSAMWTSTRCGLARWRIGNVYLTPEACDAEIERREIVTRLKRWIERETELFEPIVGQGRERLRRDSDGDVDTIDTYCDDLSILPPLRTADAERLIAECGDDLRRLFELQGK